jgi:predicted Zn-dependent peptidase
MSTIFQHQLVGGPLVVGYHLPGLTASAGLIVSAGSAREPDGQRGVGHVLNQAVFRCTATRNAAALQLALEDRGLRKDSAMNPEWARYWLVGLAEDLPAALPLLAECVLAPGLDDADVAAARAQALGRLSKRREQRELYVTDLLRAASFLGHPLSNPTLGTAAEIENLSTVEVRRYHSAYHRSDGMVLAVAGEFDWARVLDVAAASFPPGPARLAVQLPPAAHGAARVGEVWPVHQQQVALALPGPRYGDPDFYTWAVVTHLLGGGSTSRLFQAVRDRLGLTYGASARLVAHSSAGQVLVYGTTVPRQAVTFASAVAEIVRALGRTGVAAQELATAKAQLASELVMRGESTAARMHTVLTSALLEPEIRGIEQTEAAIARVGPDDVARVLAHWHPAVPIGLATVGPVPVEEVSRGLEPAPVPA